MLMILVGEVNLKEDGVSLGMDTLTAAGFFGEVTDRLFGLTGYSKNLATFVFYAKIIVMLILVLYAKKVLGLGTRGTLIAAAILFLAFFTNFWIFGSLFIVVLVIIAFLLIGILGFTP